MAKATKQLWFPLILIGLMGQLAWTIENMYFNVYLYNTIARDPQYIAAMVALSAIVATLTTLFMGALSDRVGKRKVFICAGYILWGLSTLAFGLVTVENAQRLFPAANAVHLAAVMVIALDCVMTFFGSTANDAAFNAYVTDNVPDERRGRMESVLATLPLLSMLIIFGAFDSMTQEGRWREFFLIFGVAVTAVGFLSIVLLKDAPLTPSKVPFGSQLLHGFRLSTIRTHAALYLTLCALCVFSIAVQIFFPYLIIYMQHYLGLDSYAIVLGIVLIVASVFSVAMGRMIDRVGRLRLVLPSAALMLLGLFGMYFAREMVWVILAGSVMMSGYMLVTATLTAEMRSLTPPEKAGHFQGIRMIFAVMLPMIIGPFIGAAVIRGNSKTYTELGVTQAVPTPVIFLAAAVALLLVLIPFFFLKRREQQ